MTTAVIIQPAGHKLKIEMAEGPEGDRSVTTTELGADAHSPVTYHLYGDRTITIQEIP